MKHIGEKINQPASISITLRGLIFISLGGYTGEANGLRSRENTDKVINGLSEFIRENNCLIACVDGDLKFIVIDKQKPWYKFW